VLAGGALAYTLVVSNRGGSTLTNIAVTDIMPPGLTWVSTSVTRPVTSNPTYADNFATSGSWSNSSGTAAWSALVWSEVDNGGVGATTGNLRKENDLTGDLSAHFRQGSAINNAISRVVGDLSTASAVTLTLDHQCVSLENDVVEVQIRPNGSAGWTTLASHANCDDGNFVADTYPLTSGQWGSATEIRFIVTNAFSASNDDFYVDNVQFAVTARTQTATTGTAPPALYTIADLNAGESATIVVNTTVDTPLLATDELYNIATARSGNEVARADVTDCVRCFDYGDDPASFEGAGTNPARARVSSRRDYIADTFQSGGYTGNTGNTDWTGTT